MAKTSAIHVKMMDNNAAHSMEIQAKLKGAAFLLHSTSSFSQVFGMLLQVAETNGGHQTNYLSWKISLKALPLGGGGAKTLHAKMSMVEHGNPGKTERRCLFAPLNFEFQSSVRHATSSS